MAWTRRKPKYIRKYDYKRSFIRAKDQWFWPIDEIEKVLNNQILSEYKKQHKDSVIDVDGEKEESADFEFDKDLDLERFEDEDIEEAVVKEGKIIDQLAKQYLQQAYPNNLVIDFDDKKYSSLTNEEIAEETLKLLSDKRGDILIFQGCFIAKQKAIAKPDAVLKQNNKILLIEVKSTTKFKKDKNIWKEKTFTDKKGKAYLLDLVYQKNVVEAALEENKLSFTMSYQLCVINNKLPAKKYTTHFDIVHCDEKLVKFSETYEYVSNTFWERIDELIDAKISSTFSLAPNHENRSAIGDNECWNLFKEYYYVSSKYPFFGLSTQTIINPRALKDTAVWYLYEKYKNTDPTNLKAMVDIVAKEGCLCKAGVRYHNAIKDAPAKPNYLFSLLTLSTLNRKLKKKKVYFDFETLNSALAAFDNCYPYRQVVVQASIIKDHGDGKLIAKNLICDPENITIGWFKKVVDTILEGVDDVNEYSFVVYNKSFEHRCLNDIVGYINEPEYTKKIISFNGPLDKGSENNNLFDLADFFDNRKPDSCYIWPVKGFYSIKKILDFVMNDKESHAFDQVGCKNYKSLDVQNGSQAQDEINNRFFGMIKDADWKRKEQYLKQYCENDVRAMIALEYWLKEH